MRLVERRLEPDENKAPALGLKDPGYDPSCWDCDHDTHRCHGCGEPLPHSVGICSNCRADINREKFHLVRGDRYFEPDPLGARRRPRSRRFRVPRT